MSRESVTPFLKVMNVSKRFSDTQEKKGLRNINFEIQEGMITALIGESGAGKSTLFRLIYGLAAPDQGEIQFRGIRVKGPAEQLIPGHPRMRLVTQHFDDLNQYARVWDNISSQLSNADLERKNARTEAVLKQMKIDHLRMQRIVDLSGGEKQRVALARALITEPDILLMDEPFNQVDTHFRDSLQNDLRDIVSETGLTIFFVSHDPAEIIGLADFLVILKDGQLIRAGAPLDVYEQPRSTYVANLLARTNILDQSAQKKLELVNVEGRIVVHPEWLSIVPCQEGKFIITKVLYKGFYREVWLCRESLVLRCYIFGTDVWIASMRVNVRVIKWARVD